MQVVTYKISMLCYNFSTITLVSHNIIVGITLQLEVQHEGEGRVRISSSKTQSVSPEGVHEMHQNGSFLAQSPIHDVDIFTNRS